MLDLTLCQVCGSKQWVPLPDPNAHQCVTTAGRIIQQPLGKSQCEQCGLVQREREPFLGFTDYYEQDYANYYERPGTEKFHLQRYTVMIEWMNQFIIDGDSAKNVLDVGCGQGWAMKVFAGLYPKSTIEGIEPSNYNSKRAEEKGFKVYEGKLEDSSLKENHYDILFSNNVIQHVNNAGDFLQSLKKLISKDGVIIITCPDGSLPNIELLWGDQNFSFLPQHLIKLASDLDFKTVYWTRSPFNSSLPPAQLLILTNNLKYSEYKTVENYTVLKEEALTRRVTYLNVFPALNTSICEQIKDSQNVYNLGASYWTSILAAYCPDYWNKVKQVVLDELSDTDTFLGKKIISSKKINPTEKDILVLGIAPASHQSVKERLKNEWKKIITFDNLVKY